MPRHKTQSRRPPEDGQAQSLTPSEKTFLNEYLIDLNGTRAYRVAFPKCSYAAARMAASRLVSKDNIRAEIRAARRDQQQRTQITADKVLREIARVAFSDVVDLVDDCDQLRPLRQIPLEARRAIAGVKVKQERITRRVTKNGKTETTVTTHERVIEIRFWDKLGALETLFKHLGLETEITPLEALLQVLPRTLAMQIRAALLTASNGKPAGRQPDQATVR